MNIRKFIRLEKALSTRLLDLTSMGLSGLCVVHCLLLPFVFAALPALGNFGHSEWVHQVLVSLALPLTAWTFYRSGAWRKWNVVLFAGFGLMLLALAAFYVPVQADEVFISVIGAAYVGMAHLINYIEHAYAHHRQIPHACH